MIIIVIRQKKNIYIYIHQYMIYFLNIIIFNFD